MSSEAAASSTTKSSWFDIDPSSDFSIHNIPFGVCSFPKLQAESQQPRCCTAIGNYAVDLSMLSQAGLFSSIDNDNDNKFNSRVVFSQSTLNMFMSFPKPIWVFVRNRIIDLFSHNGSDDLRLNSTLQASAIHPIHEAKTHLPATVGDYTDFYSSLEHATNVGTMFRGRENALQPNWLHLPVGYHGRSSSVYCSGTDIIRPRGQLQSDPADPRLGSTYGNCKLLDFELEMAFFVGGRSGSRNKPEGKPISMEEANDRIFGYVLMNDWSARDIQKWEYVPLGPFGSKNFATTISPWIVTTMALQPYQCGSSTNIQDPKPLDYLQDPNYNTGSYDINLKVSIQGVGMKRSQTVCESNFRNLYWNSRQQLVHHAVTGCNMQPGDLLGSGTISGKEESSFGSLLELCWKGSKEVKLGDCGEVRKFLRDGDVVTMEGWCGDDSSSSRVGFGSCIGKVLPAVVVIHKNDTLIEETEEQQHRFTDFKLYGYWRSSCTWRVRIALAAKNIRYTYIPIDLIHETQTQQSYINDVNPMAQIPVLTCIDTQHPTKQEVKLTQSLAIIEFIEDAFLTIGGSLYPQNDALLKTKAKEYAELINSGVQPLQNLSLLKTIQQCSNNTIVGKDWAKQVIEKGLHVLETLIAAQHKHVDSDESSLLFACGGYAPTIADACIIPQLYNARRYDVNVDELYPCLAKIESSCLNHPWFVTTHPDVQSDKHV